MPQVIRDRRKLEIASRHAVIDSRAASSLSSRPQPVNDSSYPFTAIRSSRQNAMWQPRVRRSGSAGPPTNRESIGRCSAFWRLPRPRSSSEIFARRSHRGDGLVANRGEPEPGVLVPHVHERDGKSLQLRGNHFARLISRIVIGDKHFVRHLPLRANAAENQVECRRPVVCGSDQ